MLTTHFTDIVHFQQDSDFHCGSQRFPGSSSTSIQEGLAAASVSLHNLTAIRRPHMVGVKTSELLSKQERCSTQMAADSGTRVRPLQTESCEVHRDVHGHVRMLKA